MLWGMMANANSITEGTYIRAVEAARCGDPAAVHHLWTDVRPYLLQLAQNQLGQELRSKLDASDIVQQSLLEAQQGLDSFRGGSDAAFMAWLRRLVERNSADARKHFRDAKRRAVAREQQIDAREGMPIVDATQLTASALARQAETARALARAIRQLPERHRMIVEMRHRDGLGYAEIAHRLNTTETAARKLWTRAIQRLRETMDPIDELGATQAKRRLG